jgi:hypothetical protein
MLRSLTSRLLLTTLLGCCAIPVVAVAQSQSDESVAAAAKKAREQKKTAPKPVKVVTEDDIPARIGGSADQPAQQPAAATDTPAAPPADGSVQQPAGLTPKTGASKAPKEAEITALKASVARAKEDAEFLTKALGLAQDTYFSNPDYAHDTAGKAKLDDIQQQIDDKQSALAKLKAKLAELLAGAPGGPDADQPSAATSVP